MLRLVKILDSDKLKNQTYQSAAILLSGKYGKKKARRSFYIIGNCLFISDKCTCGLPHLIVRLRPYEEYARGYMIRLLEVADALRANDIAYAREVFPEVPAQCPGVNMNVYIAIGVLWLQIKKELFENACAA